MNQDKAREFFSAYYEGSLERGLKQTFEQRLRADAQLMAEYRAFQRTMEELDQLKFEEIDVPSYLSDRIATRIEEARAAQKPRNPLTLWLPRLAIGGLAAAALIFGVLNLRSGGGPQVSGATTGLSPAAPVWPSETVTVSADRGPSATIHYQSATERSVRILDQSSNRTLSDSKLQAQQLLSTDLGNPNPNATLFEVRVSNAGPDEYVAVPGRNPETPASAQSGTIADLAKALADKYHVPIVLNAHDLGKATSIDLSGPDAMKAALKSVSAADYDVLQSNTGVVSISAK